MNQNLNNQRCRLFLFNRQMFFHYFSGGRFSWALRDFHGTLRLSVPDQAVGPQQELSLPCQNNPGNSKGLSGGYTDSRRTFYRKIFYRVWVKLTVQWWFSQPLIGPLEYWPPIGAKWLIREMLIPIRTGNALARRRESEGRGFGSQGWQRIFPCEISI